MGEAQFRFYAELNDFLAPELRFRSFPLFFIDIATVKDKIEALGIPHTEVDLVLVNGEPVDFACRVKDGDRVSVYPVFEAFDIAPVSRLRPEPLREPRFVLDVHLGKLAAFIRMLGFDALYNNSYSDSELAAISKQERRILLTRDVGLLKRGAVSHGYFIRNTDVRAQLLEVARRFDLTRLIRPFSRCMRCNSLLLEAESEHVAGLPGGVTREYAEFRRCPRCERIYWKGGHYRRMLQLIEETTRIPNYRENE